MTEQTDQDTLAATAKKARVDALAADIREVDGKHDLGAAALAEALVDKGWGVPQTYPSTSQDGTVTKIGPNVVLLSDGPAIEYEGKRYVLAKTENLQPALKQYKDGEQVEVFKNGAWLPGFITSREKGSSMIHVHTDRGPVSVASTHGIRKPSA